MLLPAALNSSFRAASIITAASRYQDATQGFDALEWLIESYKLAASPPDLSQPTPRRPYEMLSMPVFIYI